MRRLKPTTELIYVSTIQKLYRCIDGEWFEQVNYTTRQISSIVNASPKQVRNIIRKLNLRPKIISRDRLNYEQVQIIVKAVQMKNDTPNKTYKQIRNELNV